MTETKNNGKLIAIITMCFIFAMISFVTNMGAISLCQGMG